MTPPQRACARSGEGSVTACPIHPARVCASVPFFPTIDGSAGQKCPDSKGWMLVWIDKNGQKWRPKGASAHQKQGDLRDFQKMRQKEKPLARILHLTSMPVAT